MMKEYGEQSTWEKLYTMAKLDEMKPPAQLVPLYFTRWDEFILSKQWEGIDMVQCQRT